MRLIHQHKSLLRMTFMLPFEPHYPTRLSLYL